ncbi:MAG: toll/interleukin-1 receptor domain-containing protein [Clostridia bacterium]|nr:toll/interleukin-1 receptor domain-containing protein [Clostridia bacterium]
MERPSCYQGEEAFIFVSYAHKDSEKVWPIITRLGKDGYRVWYDDGIDPGSEWDENIAAHVAECGYFVAFLSKNYLASNNCKDELNFARDQGKPQLLIYLEDVEIPQGMAMRLGRNQAIFYDRYQDKEAFFVKLYDAQDIEVFHENFKPVVPKPEVKESVLRETKNKPIRLIVVAILVVAVLVVIAAGFFLRGIGMGKMRKEVPQKETETSKPIHSEETLRKVTNMVLADNEQIKVTAIDTVVDDRYYTLSLAVENKGMGDLYLTTQNFYLDGVAFDPDWRGTLKTGDTSLVEMLWNRETMLKYGLDPEKITLIEGEMSGRYLDNSGEIDICPVVYHPYGQENVKMVTYTPEEGDVVLLDTEEFLVVATDSYFGEEDMWVQEFVCVNRTEQNQVFDTEEDSLNRHRLLNGISGLSELVYAGRIAYSRACYYGLQWRSTGQDAVLEYSGKFDITNPDNRKDPQRALYPFTVYPQGEAAARELSVRQLTAEEILIENEYIRVAYLGSREVNDSNGDMFYFLNLTEEDQKFDFSLLYENEKDSVGIPCHLHAGQEGMILSHRMIDVGIQGSPAVLQLRIQNIHEEVTVIITNPPEE